MLLSKEIHLQSRPSGEPTVDNFLLVDVEVPAPGEGEVLVQNLWMSVDPFMRFPMMLHNQPHYPLWQIGEAPTGDALGRVIESNDPKFSPGELVLSWLGWREHFVARGEALKHLGPKPKRHPLQRYLGALGGTGFAAYVGLIRVANLQDGETVFVSGAAGATGSVACQIAKAKGCKVIATAGSDEKCQWLKDVAGVDHAINYKTVAKLNAAIAEAAPEGLNVYFDNVGGDHLVAALANMAPYGRIAVSGSISQYNRTGRAVGPHNLHQVVPRRIRLEGFEAPDHEAFIPQFEELVGGWIDEGKLVPAETVYEGLGSAPRALVGLFNGANLGKSVVNISGRNQA